MHRYVRLIALIVLAASAAGHADAQTALPPPEWKDNGPSVYLGWSEKSLPSDDSPPSVTSADAEPEQVTTSRKFDSSVVPSAHVEQSLPAESGRHLAPPSTRAN